MTTPDPLDDILLPYAVDLLANGTSNWTVPSAQRNGATNANEHRLNPGTYDIELTADCANAVNLQMYKGGGWGGPGAFIEQGTTWYARSSEMVTINVPEGTYVRLRIWVTTTLPLPSSSSGHSGALLIYPIKKAGA